MKKLTASLFIILSLSFAAHAADVVQPTVGTIMSPFASSVLSTGFLATSSGKECDFMNCKEAAAVLVDAEEHAQSGKLTVFLNQKIRDLQADEELSTEEAIDQLVETAQKALKLN